MAAPRNLDFLKEIEDLQESLKAHARYEPSEPVTDAPTPPQPKSQPDLLQSIIVPVNLDVLGLQIFDDYAPAASPKLDTSFNNSTKTILAATSAAKQAICDSETETFSMDSFNLSSTDLAKRTKNVISARQFASNWKSIKFKPKDFNTFRPDSYVIINDSNQPIEIIYLDERKNPFTLNSSHFPETKRCLEQNRKQAPDEAEMQKQNEIFDAELAKYRKDIQNKDIRDANKKYYLKFANPNILLLELFNANAYRLLCNDAPEATLCVNNDGNIAAIATEELKGFVSLKDDPLTKSDLPISVFDQGHVSAEIFTAMSGYESVYPDSVLDNYNNSTEIFKIIVYQNPKTEQSVTVCDFRNFLLQKRLGISIATSYLYDEDDLHRNNLGKRAEAMYSRLDYDKSLRISSQLKDSKYYGVDTLARKTDEKTFIKSHEDMKTLPAVRQAMPYYFPGVNNLKATATGANQNAYSSAENAIFEELAFKPVFYYYKLKMILKFLLTTEEMYQQIAKQKIPVEYKSLADEFIKQVMKNHADIRQEVLKWDKNGKFNDKVLDWEAALIQYGEQWANEVEREFAENLAKNKWQKINVEELKKNQEDTEAKKLLTTKQKELARIYLEEPHENYRKLKNDVAQAALERSAKQAALGQKTPLKNSGSSGSGKNFFRP